MANIRHSITTDAIVGSHAAVTFQRNAAGSGTRTRGLAKQPRSTNQDLARNRLAQASYDWSQTLSAANRASWAALAALTDWTNSSGVIFHPTGRAIYIRQAIIGAIMGSTPRTTAPAVADVATPVITLSYTGGFLCVSNWGGAALAAGTLMIYHRSVAQKLTVNYPPNCNDYSYVYDVTGPPATPFVLRNTSDLLSGKRYFYRFTYWQYSAEPAAPYTNKSGTCSWPGYAFYDKP